MKIKLLVVGKTDDKLILQGIEKYEARLKHYIGFERIEINAPKGSSNISVDQVKKQEAELILKQVTQEQLVVLLDEKGVEFDSRGFAQYINQKMSSGNKSLVFIVGGAFGFSPSVYERAQFKLSLSKMTFSHQMIRLFFTEQVYRAMTILKGESYHHD